MVAAPAPPAPEPGRAGFWRHLRGGLPALLAWSALVGLLAYLLLLNAAGTRASDEANLREWLDESRVFRKTLRDLADEYLHLQPSGAPPGAAADDDAMSGDPVRLKAEEIREQLRAMAEPTRMYQASLPLFPVIFRLELAFPPGPGGGGGEVVAWESKLPRPRGSADQLHRLDYSLLKLGDGRRVRLRAEYLLHTAGRVQREEEKSRTGLTQASLLLVTAGVLAAGWGAVQVRRERQHELRQLEAAAAVEHAELTAAREGLRASEAERRREELDRQLLEERLKAAAAERQALESKSQLYAAIGVMAGSYAHNIKNLLVRPNDLLARCLERDGLSADQQSMLGEVRLTLGTVTERLQQILRTVHRDPNRTEMARLDLNEVVRDMGRTWADTAREKWKLTVQAEPASEPLWVEADRSHLQQAAENLLFNARDATFEMRGHLRESARKEADPARRKASLIEAAGWKGVVTLRAWREGDRAVLEVRDNGVGMTEEVRQRCAEAHFTTKRDKALYEGYTAGMGLGLSFVAVVLDHHRADLAIESRPGEGAAFRMSFPLAEEKKS
jgi:signal transduction histidine kinase